MIANTTIQVKNMMMMAINQKVIGVSTLIASILNLNVHRVQYDHLQEENS